MNASVALPIPRPAPLPRPLKIAIGASIAVHLLALAWQHGPQLPRADDPPPLHIVLRPAAARPASVPTPAPAPVAIPAATPLTRPPVRVEAPHPPAVLTRPAAVESPRPTPPAAASHAAAPAETAPAPTAAPAAPAIETAARPAAAVTVAHAAPPPATAADETPDPALLERYGRSLSALFARQQNYPRLAAMRGWEGEVQLRITVARKGNIVATQIVRSSGFEVLDQNAIQLVSTAGPLPQPPENLHKQEIQIVVPVRYKLEKPS